MKIGCFVVGRCMLNMSTLVDIVVLAPKSVYSFVYMVTRCHIVYVHVRELTGAYKGKCRTQLSPIPIMQVFSNRNNRQSIQTTNRIDPSESAKIICTLGCCVLVRKMSVPVFLCGIKANTSFSQKYMLWSYLSEVITIGLHLIPHGNNEQHNIYSALSIAISFRSHAVHVLCPQA